mmetsp:Transcript_334/g.1332  ORF Transcript_334/g.1332 Transcript_334/m.1332 type:complete len:252 (-) Transcript_334:299-1054(-)
MGLHGSYRRRALRQSVALAARAQKQKSDGNCHHCAMARIGGHRLHRAKSHVAHGLLEIEQVILVGPGLGGLHEREERGRQALDHRRARIVVGEHQHATRPQHAPRLAQDVARGVRGKLVKHEGERHDVRARVLERHRLGTRMQPVDVRERRSLAARGGHSQEVRAQVHASHLCVGERLRQRARADANAAPHVEHALDVTPCHPPRAIRMGAHVRAQRVQPRVAQPALRLLRRQVLFGPHAQRHRVRRRLRF